MTLLLYRVQERVAITPAESKVITVIGLLFLLGIGAGEIRRMRSANAFDYSTVDSMFAQAAAHYAARESRPIAQDSTGYKIWDDSVGTTPVAARRGVDAGTSLAGMRLNLNTATHADLQRLPRIGPALAQRIIDHRNRRGPFRAVRDLTHVRGIGAKTLALLDSLVTVDDTTRSGSR